MYKKVISIMSVMLVVFLCINFPAYASIRPGTSYVYSRRIYLSNDTDFNDNVYAFISCTSFNPTRETFKVNGDYYQDIYTFKVFCSFFVCNKSNQDFMATSPKAQFLQVYIQPDNTTYPASSDLTLTNVDVIDGVFYIPTVTSNGLFKFETQNASNNGTVAPIVIPAHSNVYCNFELTYTLTTFHESVNQTYTGIHYSDSSVYLNSGYGDFYGTFGDYHENYISYLPDIYSELESIDAQIETFLNAYLSNVPASQNVTSDAQSSSNTIDNQHQQEANLYNQTNQAIGSTGIQNFQFDSQTIGGLGGVKNDFMAVWNSLGTFNSVFITSLTIGLALSIVRHRRMFKQ